MIWPLLQHSADPRLRSFIINWLHPLGADARVVIAEFDRLESLATSPCAGRAPARWTPSSSTRETSMRRALILALGTYKVEDLPADEPSD